MAKTAFAVSVRVILSPRQSTARTNFWPARSRLPWKALAGSGDLRVLTSATASSRNKINFKGTSQFVSSIRKENLLRREVFERRKEDRTSTRAQPTLCFAETRRTHRSSQNTTSRRTGVCVD